MRAKPAPLVIERVHAWHLPFVLVEASRGRRVYFRSLDIASERSKAVTKLIASRALVQLQLRTPVLTNMHPATDLAFSFIDDHFGDIAGRSGIGRAAARIFGDRDIKLAYRKALVDLLTTYFHLALLAQSCQETFGRDVRIVPEALRDADAFRVGLRATRGWSHDGYDRPHAMPLWIDVAGRVHAVLRNVRAWISTVRLGLARSDRVAERRAADVAFAIVSTARDVPPGSRSAEFLVDGKRLQLERCLFVPLSTLSDDERRTLLTRGLRVPEAVGLRPDRAGYLRASRAGLGAPGWMIRTTAELLRAHARWHHFVAAYDVSTFVSRADTGVSAVARSLVLRRAGVRTVGYSDSGNFGFHAGQDQRSRGPAIPHFAYLVYDDFATWNDRMLRYLSAHRQHVGRYHVIGCPWSDQIAEFRRAKDGSPLISELRAHGLQPGHRLVAFFDSWYHPHGVNVADDLTGFLADSLRLLDEREDVFLLMKKKVPIMFKERDAARIYALHDEIQRHPRAHVFPPSSDTSHIAAISDVIISFPFTSVTHEALAAGIPGAIYDARSKLRGWYYDEFPGMFLHGYEELRLGVDEMLARPAEEFVARIASAQRSATELNLALGAIDRLRQLVGTDQPSPAGSSPV